MVDFLMDLLVFFISLLTIKLPQESIKQAMSEFSKLLNRKEFLMQYIQGLDEAKNLKQKDR